MVIQVLALLVGAGAGFIVSRQLRRPANTAQAASMARTVGGTLGRRRGLDAPELQRACFSEMVRHVRVNRQGRTHAPARYQLLLHPDDLAIVDDARQWFRDGLVEALRKASSDNGWVLDGPIEIDFRSDPARMPGVPSALAITPETNDATPPPAPAPKPAQPSLTRATAPVSRTLVLVRGDTGESIPLIPGVFTIGRSRDRTITIDDNRVSRAHAHLEARSGGWFVIDDGSANGTIVGETPLESGRAHQIRPGDVISVGPVTLSVTTGPETSGEPGTRALDHAERTRISGQVLPPTRPPRP